MGQRWLQGTMRPVPWEAKSGNSILDPENRKEMNGEGGRDEAEIKVEGREGGRHTYVLFLSALQVLEVFLNTVSVNQQHRTKHQLLPKSKFLDLMCTHLKNLCLLMLHDTRTSCLNSHRY